MLDSHGAKKNNVSEFAVLLLEAVADSGNESGIEQLLDIGFRMLENPIVITDKSWQSIAMTRDIDIPDDKDWNDFKTNGYLSADAVSNGMRDNLANRIENSHTPFIYQESAMKYPRMMSRLTLGGKTAATISVIAYRRHFHEDDELKLKLLGNAVTAELQKSSCRQLTRGMVYESFIESLLEGNIRNPQMIEERVKLLNIGIKKNVYVFVFDITGFDTKQYTVAYLRDLMEKMISGGQALVYDEKIVIAASFERTNDIFKSELHNLGDFLKKYNIRCGISRRCTQLSELRFYYEQALDALRIGTHMDFERYIYPYGDYAFYHIAEVCCRAGGSETFCHPALKELIAHDEEYRTAFARSLYAYLCHFRNITDAAKSQHLHRSTMVYHLRRIEEIMGIRLSDFRTSQLLDISYRILEYEKLLDYRPKNDSTIEKEN